MINVTSLKASTVIMLKTAVLSFRASAVDNRVVQLNGECFYANQLHNSDILERTGLPIPQGQSCLEHYYHKYIHFNKMIELSLSNSKMRTWKHKMYLGSTAFH